MGDGGRPPCGWIAFYLALLVAGVAFSLARGFQGDLFWLVIGWAIALGLLTRLLGLRPPR